MDMITLAMAKAYTDSKQLAKSVVEYKKIVPDTALELWTDSGTGRPTEIIMQSALIEGNTYRVKTDSGTYTAVCKKVTEPEAGVEMFCLGNLEHFGFDATSETYGFASYEADGMVVGFIVDYDNGTTFSVDEKTETIHPIDPKFLPGACLPVVELETAIPVDGVAITLSAKDGDNLTAACEKSPVICIKFNLDIEGDNKPVVCAVFNGMTVAGVTALTATFEESAARIDYSDNRWEASYG